MIHRIFSTKGEHLADLTPSIFHLLQQSNSIRPSNLTNTPSITYWEYYPLDQETRENQDVEHRLSNRQHNSEDPDV